MVTYDYNLYLFKTSQVFHELKLWYFFAHFYWFNESVPTLGIITNILLIVVGMFASSIIFGMGFNAVGRLISKIFTGKWESMPSLSLLMGIISSVVTFFSVKYIILFLT